MAHRIDRQGPHRFELLFTSPKELTEYVTLNKQREIISTKKLLPWTSDDTWSCQPQALENDEKYIALRKHFIDGVSWEECGIYDHVLKALSQQQRVAESRGALGSYDGCRSQEEFEQRYSFLDSLYDQVKAEGRLKCAWEIHCDPLAQKKGIYAVLTKQGNFLFGGVGFHRLVIAQALELPLIPVSLTIAHINAVSNGHLARLREQRNQTLQDLGLALPNEALFVARSKLAASLEK